MTAAEALLAFSIWLALIALAALATAAGRALAKRRQRVIGARVPDPEWRARRLKSGHWIVERNRERVA